MKKKIVVGSILLGFITVVLLITCGSQKNEINAQSPIKTVSSPTKPKAETQFSAWTAYWDLENTKEELLLMNDNMKNLCHFAAYFNSQNELILPKEATEFFQTVKKDFAKKNWTHYITIVNDQVDEEDSFSLKDTELLYQLFSTEASMDKHIQEIINLAITDGYDGIEIDYEAIRADLKLWKLFMHFCNKLYHEATIKGLKMRVLLESDTPFKKITIPVGPEYVMMCYNLYGMHSEPGPKANQVFIKELIKQMNVLPGRKNFAIATGGFDWSADSKVTSLTEIQAYSLAIEYGAEAIRDLSSQCLVYEYEDSNNNHHEVWYADAVTLNNWTQVIQNSGDYGVSIWRLGGNRRDSEVYFSNQYKQDLR